MIEHLEIKNFALIENLNVDFSEGFNVITGETGAGKSIILGALGFLMGERADSGAIRSGSDEMVVNAVVSIPQGHEILEYLKERDIEPEDGQIIIKRQVKTNGKSIVYVQGQPITRAELTVIADSLIDMHGQSEHQSLLSQDKQRKILDSFAKNTELVKNTAELYKQVTELEKKKEELEKELEEAKTQQDWLQFALEEIEGAKIQVGEDESLKEKISLVGQYETIFQNINSCNEALKQTRSLFYDASSYASKSAKCDNSLTEYVGRIESIRIEAEDILQSLESYISDVDYSEDAVNQMQERAALLQKLKRKYGQTLEQVLSFAQEAKRKLEDCSNSEELIAKCKAQLEKTLSEYRSCALLLSKRRAESALVLQKKIEGVLKTLGMPNAVFSIQVERQEDKVSANGFDTVAFMICPNPGENLRQMKEIASGGELSRVMLALKTVLAKEDSIQTQVFDEVDAGIGGAVALSLAGCISDLSKEKQVIVITHLASVAAKASRHFIVSKTVEDGRTYTHLKAADDSTRVSEIARMLSGDESEVSIEHARQLLNS